MKAQGKVALDGYKNPLKVYVGGVWANLKGRDMNDHLHTRQYFPLYRFVTREWPKGKSL